MSKTTSIRHCGIQPELKKDGPCGIWTHDRGIRVTSKL